MKHKLVALGLLTAPGLFAANESEYCPPDPCCVPQPKECIDCECYTPQYYDLQCDWGLFLSADFLYWYARESNLAYAVKIQSIEQTFPQTLFEGQSFVFVPKRYKHIDTDWDPGFRVGLGWSTECDGWDFFAHWTYFHNKESSSTSVPKFSNTVEGFSFLPSLGQFALINPWTNPSLADFDNPLEIIFDKISAKWKLNFNSIDLEIGRKYWLSSYFTLRPFAGLRGAWTKTKFRTTSSYLNTDFNPITRDINFKDRFTNRFWGVGLVAGFQPNWYFSSCFALFGNLDASLIWGEFETTKRERYLAQDTITPQEMIVFISLNNKSKGDFFMMQAILDLALGLHWEETWCCDRFRTALDVGWEHHIWFDHNHRNKIANTKQTKETEPDQISFKGFLNFDENTGNLMFGGLVIRFRFDF